MSDYAIDVEVDDAFTDLVDTAMVAAAVAETLRQQGIAGGAVTVVITDDATVQEMNATYRSVDAPTDVLSFAARERGSDEVELALPPDLAAEEAAYWGDLVIAYPYTARQASQFGTTVAAELCLLAVHGTLHLVGYDHATPADQARMWAAQDGVLASLGYAGVGDHRADSSALD